MVERVLEADEEEKAERAFDAVAAFWDNANLDEFSRRARWENLRLEMELVSAGGE